MSGDRSVVAVDIGNSAVKLVARTADQQSVRWASPLGQPEWPQHVVSWTLEHLAGADLEWRIASVHRASVQRFREAISQLPKALAVSHVTHTHVPMPIQVDQPDRLGIDRLLGAWAAYREFHSPLVVVDVGSAITIDRVSDDGTFLGGAILPGIGLQVAALASGTDALPIVDWRCNSPLRIPATNTENAIRVGVLAGLAGSIDRIIELYHNGDQPFTGRSSSKAAGGKVQTGRFASTATPVVLTGGDASALEPLLRHATEHRPDLVCRALLDLPRLKGPSPAVVKADDRQAFD